MKIVRPIVVSCWSAASLAAIVLFPVASFAQSPLWTFPGSEGRPVGDINHDGFDDVILGNGRWSCITGGFPPLPALPVLVGQPGGAPDCGGPYTGGARLVSGQDGGVLYTFWGTGAYDYFGDSVDGAGDVDGDGWNDVIVGAPQFSFFGPDYLAEGYVRVFSGKDGSLLHHLVGDAPSDAFGFTEAGVGDLDADGFDDFAVGALQWQDQFHSDSTGPGYVRVFSGATGSILYNIVGDYDCGGIGFTLAAAGDVNRDGVPDLIVTDLANSSLCSGPSAVKVVSGADASILHLFEVPWPMNFGAVDGGEDLDDDDGYSDFIFGSPDDMSGDGAVSVVSGRDGSLLYHLVGAASSSFGTSAGFAGDVDDDGTADFIVGSPWEGDAGAVRVFSGSTGSVLYHLTGTVSGRIGYRVSGAGDVDGDGCPDFLVSSGNKGTVYAGCSP